MIFNLQLRTKSLQYYSSQIKESTEKDLESEDCDVKGMFFHHYSASSPRKINKVLVAWHMEVLSIKMPLRCCKLQLGAFVMV